MKKISAKLLSKVIKTNREKYNISQLQLAEKTNINRAMISKIESEKYMPSVEQLEKLEEVLNFTIDDILQDDTVKPVKKEKLKHMNIAVAGTGYVGDF